MKITTGRIALAAALAAGIPLVAAGCGDSTPATPATTAKLNVLAYRDGIPSILDGHEVTHSSPSLTFSPSTATLSP